MARKRLMMRQGDSAIPDSRLAALRVRMRSIPEVAAVYLFGSAARGSLRRRSDVDIALLTLDAGRARGARRPVSFYMMAVCDALGTDRVDLVLLDRAPVVLRHEVLREGKLLFSRNPEVLSDFRERSSREYLDTIPLRRAFEEAYFRRIRRRGFARQDAHR